MHINIGDLSEKIVKVGKSRTRLYSLLSICIIGLLFFSAACRQDMASQPRYDPLEESQFFEDGQSARQLVAGTIARGQLRDDTHLYTGKDGDKLVDTFPFPITPEVLKRGQERFNIYCSVCHDRIGNGNGMVVQRGFRHPPSYHIERLRKEPVGHFFDVITNGFGAMASYSAQVNVRDRWAIVAYIRALQASQPVAPDPGATSVATTTQTPPTTQNGQPGTGNVNPTQNAHPATGIMGNSTDKNTTGTGKTGGQGEKREKVDTGGQQR